MFGSDLGLALTGAAGPESHGGAPPGVIWIALQGDDVAHCGLRIVLLHYAPVADTLVGEPEGIWTMLGTDRLAAPIAHAEPDLVLHGHAHAGTFEGRIDHVPVYNVSVPVLGRDYHLFDLEVPSARGVR